MNTSRIAIPLADLPATAVPTAAGPVRRVLALDGVRGLAILMVMAFHFHTLPATGSVWNRWLGQFSEACGSGVNLFFALSGFLITGILWDSKTDPHYLRNFYARRFLRIFPLYYGVLFAALILVPVLRAPTDPKYLYAVRHQVWLWAYVSNFYEYWTGRILPMFGHFWSLAVEEHFYLLWPFVVLWLGRRALLWTCAGCFAAAFVARLAMLTAGEMDLEMIPMRLTPCQIDGLAVGSFIALLLRPPIGSPPETLPGRARQIFAVSGLLIALLVFPLAWLPGRSHLLLSGYYSLWVVFYGAGLTAAVLGSPTNRLRRLCETAPLRTLGKYSYGLYIFHWPIGRVWLSLLERWQSAHPASLLVWPWVFQGIYLLLAAGCALLAAWLSWHLYEKHFLHLKRFFSPNPRSAPEARGHL